MKSNTIYFCMNLKFFEVNRLKQMYASSEIRIGRVWGGSRKAMQIIQSENAFRSHNLDR